MNKVFDSAEAAIFDIEDGTTLMSGGFGLCGNPENLIRALHERGTTDITVISNNCGTDDYGLGILLQARQIKKMISSYVGENKNFEGQFLSGELEVELVPQGTFVERIRAAGMGLGGILTPTGIGTLVAEGKEIVEVDGKPFLLEKPLHADFALIAARSCDYVGNLAYMLSATNFNPIMALAATTVIAEPEEIVPVGVIPPDAVKTPGVLVDHVIKRAA